jgi:hypothetical protein
MQDSEVRIGKQKSGDKSQKVYLVPLPVGDCVVIKEMSFRTNVRNLKLPLSLMNKISPSGRDDKNNDYDTISWERGTYFFRSNS